MQLSPQRVPDSRIFEWASEDVGRMRLARAGGSALATVLCDAAADDPVPLVLAVGDAVRRGLPTAARLTVASRSPASGLFVDGQLGGSLAKRLARCADALVLRGRTTVPGAVLVLHADGSVRLDARPECTGRSPFDAALLLRDSYSGAAMLLCGPAGEAGFAHASLFSGEDPPSSVGRGGLGTVLGRSGLKAIVFDIPPLSETTGTDALRARLTASPRLLARAEGGSFELIEAFAARGDLVGPGGDAFDPERVDRLRATADASRSGQHGCAGCPTPCGWVFERPGGGRRGGRFSAVTALGPQLGLADFDEAMLLLDACDRVGVDAKEIGEALSLLARAREERRLDGPALIGDVRALIGEIESLATNSGPLSGGAELVAERAGLTGALRRVRGQSVRERKSLAALLGQCVSARGADPMRAFPFLAEDGASEIDASRLSLPFDLPTGTRDSDSAAGIGRLVWWHENLSAALDATGFCAFSAGALLADGEATANELADWILPDAWRDASEPATALQSLGASVVLLQRRLNQRFGEPPRADLPDWACLRLDRPELFGDYATLRGIDADGRVIAEAAELCGALELSRWGTARLTDVGLRENCAPPTAPPEARIAGDRATGVLLLRASGALGRVLAGLDSNWLLPISIRDLRVEVCRLDPRAERWLGGPETPIASVWRDGIRLDEADLVDAGDTLDLVVAISGG